MALPALYPLVSKIITPTDLGAGRWKLGCAIGVTVHYTADRDIERVVRTCREKGVGYHALIERDGEIIQTTYFDRRVNHAGKALWRNYGPNQTHVAIALVSWGWLTERDDAFYAWNGDQVPHETVEKRNNLFGVLAPWDAATTKQEKALLTVLAWCVANGISPDHICGHDECAQPPGRKVDPGGVLSLSMEAIRKDLRAKLTLS